jgi:hypothetical protein
LSRPASTDLHRNVRRHTVATTGAGKEGFGAMTTSSLASGTSLPMSTPGRYWMSTWPASSAPTWVGAGTGVSRTPPGSRPV